jgi:hypothetical protein
MFMADFSQELQDIEEEYKRLDDFSRRELWRLMRILHKYIVMYPKAEKIKVIRDSIQRKMSQEIEKPLGIDKMGFWTLQRLRNLIVHKHKINKEILLNIGNWMWNEFSKVYSEEPQSLYNALSYVIRTENSTRVKNKSAEQISLFFYHIYQSKKEPEKIAIVQSLIPLVTPKFKEKQQKLRVVRNEDSFK